MNARRLLIIAALLAMVACGSEGLAGETDQRARTDCYQRPRSSCYHHACSDTRTHTDTDTDT